MEFTATYSPEDNKLRLYASERLDSDLYEKAKYYGFRYAPRQKLFVAPRWTPNREAFLESLAGFVGDEDTTLAERAAERAQRFKVYSDKRDKDGDASYQEAGASRIAASNSIHKAEKEASRIESKLKHAEKMWKTSEYWTYRAEGVTSHADYKARPEVTARRIKGIEKDQRKNIKDTAERDKLIAMWLNPDKELTLNRAMGIAGFGHLSMCFTLEKYPRSAEASQYEGPVSLWGALDSGIITPDQARDLSVKAYQRGNENREKWLAHYENRLAYEKAMLKQAGALHLIAPKTRPKQLPIVNYKQASFTVPNRYHRGRFDTLDQIELTKAEYAHISSDCRGTRIIDNSHRIKIAVVDLDANGKPKKWGGYGSKTVAVFLTDSKVHKKPEAIQPPEPESPEPRPVYAPRVKSATQQKIDAIDTGVTVATGEQLFITPPDLAQRVIDEANIEAGHSVLEPSAGTGALIDALPEGATVTAVEQSSSLSDALRQSGKAKAVYNSDFLQVAPDAMPAFDRVIMNPPFAKQADIDHVTHALKFLKPDGTLVAIMSAGVEFRQDKKATAFRELVESRGGVIEALPEGSFKQSGTNVNTVIVTL